MTPTECAALQHTITRKQFDEMEVDEKLGILFDVLIENRKQYAVQCQTCETTQNKCNERMDKIENRKHFDKAVSAVAGAIGGAAASIFGWKV